MDVSFADDHLVFCSVDFSSAMLVQDTLMDFFLALDFMSNLQRAACRAVVTEEAKQQLLGFFFSCSEGTFPIKYLGVSLEMGYPSI